MCLAVDGPYETAETESDRGTTTNRVSPQLVNGNNTIFIFQQTANRGTEIHYWSAEQFFLLILKLLSLSNAVCMLCAVQLGL